MPANIGAKVNGDLIARVSKGTSNYFLERTFSGERLKGRIWLPLCAMNTKLNHYVLRQGDVIKLGKVELKVREIRLEGAHSKPLSCLISNASSNCNTKVNDNHRINSSASGSKRICRICFGEDETHSPLVNPCECKGGVKYVHLHCLQEWLQTKCSPKQGDNSSYCSVVTYNKIECELCKTVLPDFVRSGNRLCEVWKFAEPKYRDYIVLESLDNKTLNSKTIYIVNFQAKNSVSIGRSKHADIHIKDASISRHHLTVESTTVAEQRAVVIKDNNSKFGTLVELQCDRTPICGCQGVTLQIGKHIVNLWSKYTRQIGCLRCNQGRAVTRDIDLNKMNNEHINLKRVFTLKEEQADCEDCEKEANKAKDSTVNEDENIRDGDINDDDDDNNEIGVCFVINKEINLRDKNKEYFGLDTVNNE